MTRNTAKHDWTVPTAGDDDYEITFDELFTDFDTDIEVRDEEQFLSSYDPDLNAKFMATDTGNIYLGDGNSWNQYPVQPEAEAVEDVVGGLLNGGTNISLNYDDGNNVLTVNTSALNQEEVEDAVASLVTAGNAITVNYDDNADALSIDVNESALSFYDGTNLTADIDATNGTFNSVNTDDVNITPAASGTISLSSGEIATLDADGRYSSDYYQVFVSADDTSGGETTTRFQNASTPRFRIEEKTGTLSATVNWAIVKIADE